MMMSSYWIVVLIFLSHSLTTHSSSLYSPSNNHPHFHLCNTYDSTALLQFINSFSIEFPQDPDLKILSWKNGTDCCFWGGVSCDQQSGHVIGLDLSDTYLKGPLHSNNTLFSLHHLQTLILDHNNFYGSPIPSEFGTSFPNLTQLSINYANFSGYIPVELSHLSKLTHLTIYTSYPIHNDIIQLETYVLKRMLQNFTNLRELSLSYLNMSNVELVTSFTNISSSLELLDLYLCGLQGKFPENVFRLPNLQQLSYITTIMLLVPCQHLIGALHSDNEFSGRLPTKYFRSFKAMMGEYATSRNLTHIGDKYYQDSVIVVMKGFERELEKIISIFVTIDFSRNNFEGEIPESIGKLKSLKGLNFSQNRLHGSIPMSLINLSNLEGLDLSSNDLSGEIPSKMADLTQLSYLNLSYNKLEGQIPRGNQFETFNNDSYKGNIKLCGFPLSKSCSTEMKREDDHGEEHTDHISLDWKFVMVGYGCGLIIGISLGYVVLYGERFDYWLHKKIIGRQQQKIEQRRKRNSRLRRRS